MPRSRSGGVEQAVKLSSDIYGSASIMLGKPADITHDNEVVDTGGAVSLKPPALLNGR